MKLGIDRLLQDPGLQSQLQGKRVALAAHPASVTSQLEHSMDVLMACSGIELCAAFGPQHGLRGEKQDNMVESQDYRDPIHHIPVYSLYGDVRRPTAQMMESFDVLLFDIQDIGCRIYTYATTLLYLLESCAQHAKSIWILDRPNPAGRPIEGSLLQPGWQSFVGAGEIIMRHGLTLGELARWFVKYHHLSVDLKVVEMEGYQINQAPGYGWPLSQLSWVNPSPNASSLNMCRFYAGSVLLEGTTLSEGRGTTVALEVMGAPDINGKALLTKMTALAPEWLMGASIRPCYFQPTFHKYANQLCDGLHVHTDNTNYQHQNFKPFRLVILFLKAIKLHQPDYPLWRDFHYEYEEERLAFDVINGGETIREWIEDPVATIEDMEKVLRDDEATWRESVASLLCYK
ncbi:MAG: exo-beta-N-acetylmuramidase NamZ domain-containing protein [Thiohalomonadales bacterium]